jgi:hypothetical protein
MNNATEVNVQYKLLFPGTEKCIFEHRRKVKVISILYNGIACNKHQCRKTAVLSCRRFLINSGVEKKEQHLNMDSNYDYQMSLSKSKCWYSNNCLHFLKCGVPFHHF